MGAPWDGSMRYGARWSFLFQATLPPAVSSHFISAARGMKNRFPILILGIWPAASILYVLVRPNPVILMDPSGVRVARSAPGFFVDRTRR
jgi:hypothetical protein